MDGLAGLPGLETVTEQLADVVAVIRTEVARREAGIAVARPAWKNLVFAGGPGSGKSRVARAVGLIYCRLGVLPSGHLIEVASVDLVGATGQKTTTLVLQAAARARRGVLMINDADVGLQASSQQALRCLLDVLNDFRDDLVIILAGQADRLRGLLQASPVLASRFPVTITFPRYTAEQLTSIFSALAHEAGFALTPAAAKKAGAVLGQAGSHLAGGSARLAVRLLQQATASHAHRITTAQQPLAPAVLCTIRATDIPDRIDSQSTPEAEVSEWPGQYL